MQPPRLMLVTEFMAGGDLFTALAKDRSEPRRFSWSREPFSHNPQFPVKINGLNKRIALDLARGVAFLHSRHIVHFDVKVMPARALSHSRPCLAVQDAWSPS